MKLLIIPFLLLIGLSLGSAQEEGIDLGKVPFNSSYNLLLSCSFNNTNCLSGATCNVTVKYPNSSLMFNNLGMGTTFFPEFNKTISDTTVFGIHTGKQTCCQSGLCGQANFFYEVTPSGDEVAGGNFLIFLYIMFGVIMIVLLYSLVMCIAKLVTVSETIYGILFSWSVYLVLLILSWLITHYSTSGFLRSNIDLFIKITAFTHILLPLISFIIAMFVRSMDKRRVLNVQEITGRHFVGYG